MYLYPTHRAAAEDAFATSDVNKFRAELEAEEAETATLLAELRGSLSTKSYVTQVSESKQE